MSERFIRMIALLRRLGHRPVEMLSLKETRCINRQEKLLNGRICEAHAVAQNRYLLVLSLWARSEALTGEFIPGLL